MRLAHKRAASVATVLVALPLLAACIAYLSDECGEYDPCPNGGWMPYAPVALVLAIAIVALAWRLLMAIWNTGESEE
jgi:hypothetical protein